MPSNGRLKISIGAVVTVALAVLIAVLGVMWTRVESNAGEITEVKLEAKANTTAGGYRDESLRRIEAGVDRLEQRFNTRPKKE